jgi:hydrogenase expression/formation protein HypC
MCLAIPAKVTRVDGDMATVEVGGVERAASLMLVSDVVAGDYVIVHAGFAIHKVDPQDAEEALRLLRQLAAAGE